MIYIKEKCSARLFDIIVGFGSHELWHIVLFGFLSFPQAWSSLY